MLDDTYKKLKLGERGQGGRIWIVEDDYFWKKDGKNYQKFLSRATPKDVCNIDLLHCVPPELVNRGPKFDEEDTSYSMIAPILKNFGFG